MEKCGLSRIPQNASREKPGGAGRMFLNRFARGSVMWKLLKAVKYLKKSNILSALLTRRPKSILAIAGIVLSLYGLSATDFETDDSGKITRPGQIFAAFAELGVTPDSVVRMQDAPPPPAAAPGNARWFTIREVVDGDSLRLDNGDTVRLLGVDAPEASENRKLREDIHRTGMPLSEGGLVHLGRAAAAFTREVARGRRCWLEFEREQRDQYGRVLAYVHLDDGSILNELVIAQGYAKVYMPSPFRQKKRYILLQTEAQFRRRGLWSAE